MLNEEKNYIKEIITDITALSERADEVDVKLENNEIREAVLELKNTLREHSDGVGLAAPQLGISKRVFVINFNGDLKSFVNPIITYTQGMTINRERCLSLPGKQYLVPRYSQIEVMYQTPLGRSECRKMVGMAAYVFQHELDHLDGITLQDIGLEIDEEFDKATEEERNEVINAYLESLDLKHKELTKEIEENPELKKMNDSIEFMAKVQAGEIKVEFDELDKETSDKIKDKIKQSK